MKQPKDLFSKQAAAYRQYRPEYPLELYDFILRHVKGRESAWDCGTGNGQVAAVLADYFQEVDATDISENQLKNAIDKDNVYYQVVRAEQTPFDKNTFDLITVAQAIHWFNFDAFYNEVRRVSKKGAVLAVWGYGLFRVDPEVDRIIDYFYKQTTGPYWDNERRYIDEEYRTIPFPFQEEGERKSFTISRQWTLAELEGFLKTWSAVQHYMKEKGENPVKALIEQVQSVWMPGEIKEVSFPVFMRLGRVV
ncbi:class I SAM-dependent methyltransferase [Cesiribacter sp. SM1]|uniref:class I SAM-dependent methyltransferase n=1 Tax=Cesiribacter sp. SM1 TaxID=2861196 RepID=UPI001CD75316|nr:class I SAM-dependent methyltransferase [Cesiribacter sp. SM1]